jgi:cell division protease FtsH
MENYERAKKVVQSNLDKLKLIAEALLERETLDGSEIDVLLAGGKLDQTPEVTTFPSLSKSSEQLEAQRAAEGKAGFPLPSPTPEKA